MCAYFIYMELRLWLQRSSRREGSSDEIPSSSVGRCWVRQTPCARKTDCCEVLTKGRCCVSGHVRPNVCKARVYNLGRPLCGDPGKKLVVNLPGKQLFGLTGDSDGESTGAGIRMVSCCVIGLVVSEHEQQWTSHRPGAGNRHRPQRRAAQQKSSWLFRPLSSNKKRLFRRELRTIIWKTY